MSVHAGWLVVWFSELGNIEIGFVEKMMILVLMCLCDMLLLSTGQF